MTLVTPSADLSKLLRLAQLAAREIMAVYASDFAVRAKADLSPVTEADAMAEKVILKGLKELWPDVPVLAEEAAAGGDVASGGCGRRRSRGQPSLSPRPLKVPPCCARGVLS